MAQLKTLALLKKQAKAELSAFKTLLDGKGKGDLSEKHDLLPFFDKNEHLCALMGTYNPNIVNYKKLVLPGGLASSGTTRLTLSLATLKTSSFVLSNLKMPEAQAYSINQVPRRPLNGQAVMTMASASSSTGYFGSKTTKETPHIPRVSRLH